MGTGVGGVWVGGVWGLKRGLKWMGFGVGWIEMYGLWGGWGVLVDGVEGG